MAGYALKKWPDKVYPGEIDKTWGALAVIDVLMTKMRSEGPAPSGYVTKHHGKELASIWQVSLKVKGRQIRLLYAQYDKVLVFLHIHKKSSPQEQKRGYELAVKRKKELDSIFIRERLLDGIPTIH